jgi:hypothetical protein
MLGMEWRFDGMLRLMFGCADCRNGSSEETVESASG